MLHHVMMKLCRNNIFDSDACKTVVRGGLYKAYVKCNTKQMESLQGGRQICRSDSVSRNVSMQIVPEECSSNVQALFKSRERRSGEKCEGLKLK